MDTEPLCLLVQAPHSLLQYDNTMCQKPYINDKKILQFIWGNCSLNSIFCNILYVCYVSGLKLQICSVFGSKLKICSYASSCLGCAHFNPLNLSDHKVGTQGMKTEFVWNPWGKVMLLPPSGYWSPIFDIIVVSWCQNKFFVLCCWWLMYQLSPFHD